MHGIANSQPVYIEIQLTGFYVRQAFNKGFFQKHFKTAVIPWMLLDLS